MSVEAKKLTRRFYNDISENYYLEHLVKGTLIHHEFTVMSDLLKELLAAFSKDNIVLDVGCGTGIYTKYLSKRFKFIVCLDLSKSMIQAAHGRNLSNLIIADAEHLPIRPKTIDLIVSLATLEHLPDPAIVLNQMYNALKESGKTLIMTPNPTSLAVKRRERPDKDQYERFIHPQRLRRLFEACFKPVKYVTAYILPPPSSDRMIVDSLRKINRELAVIFLSAWLIFERDFLRRIPVINWSGYLQVFLAEKRSDCIRG